MVAVDFVPTHWACVLHILESVHAEREETATQETPAASGAVGRGLGSRLGGAGLTPGPSQGCIPPSLLMPCPAPSAGCPSHPGGPPLLMVRAPTHPNTKRPVHSIQVRSPGTGVVTVRMWFPQFGQGYCIGNADIILGTPLGTAWGARRGKPRPHACSSLSPVTTAGQPLHGLCPSAGAPGSPEQLRLSTWAPMSPCSSFPTNHQLSGPRGIYLSQDTLSSVAKGPRRLGSSSGFELKLQLVPRTSCPYIPFGVFVKLSQSWFLTWQFKSSGTLGKAVALKTNTKFPPPPTPLTKTQKPSWCYSSHLFLLHLYRGTRKSVLGSFKDCSRVYDLGCAGKMGFEFTG